MKGLTIETWREQAAVWNRAILESRTILESFRDRYYGKRCFIIGNGPSLNSIDWSLFKNEYTFGLNRIYLLFERMGFVPSFYLCINPLVIEQSMGEIYNIPTQRFLPTNHIRFVDRPQDIVFFKSTEVRLFSTDITKEVSEGYTVTYAALQFAYYMGFSQVVLIGVDHYFQADGLPNSEVISEGNDVNHFDPNYFGKGVRWQLPDLQNSEKSYDLARRVYEADGRVILDGTINGRLTVFPKIDYRDVFSSQKRLLDRLSTSAVPAQPMAYAPQKPRAVAAKKYKVSAIVSTYNAEQYLAGCLEDLEKQSIASEMEIIVVDSGSQQNEKKIVEEFQRQFDNIRYTRTKDRETLYQAWNRAIQAAGGDYITNANTDDRHESYALEHLAAKLDANPDCVLVYADQNFVEEVGTERTISLVSGRGEFSSRRLYESCFIGSQPMWRRSVHEEFGGFDEVFFSAGDYEYWLRISQAHSFCYLNEVLGDHLVRGDSLEHENQGHNLDFEVATLLKCYKYANLYGVAIDARGLSGNPVFSEWCEINLLRRKTTARLQNRLPDDIVSVSDWRADQQKPTLSIIIATFNHEQELMRNLNQLNLQSSMAFEVIVVNNGSKMAGFAERPLTISYGLCHIQLKDNYGPSLARNIGAAHALSDLIAILDDDCIADSNWVANIVSHFADGNIVALRGRVLPKSNEIWLHTPANYDLGDEPTFQHAGIEMNSAFRRFEFSDQGGFDEQLWFFEGAELSNRIWKAKGNRLECIVYFPDVVIYHDCSRDPNHLFESQIRIRENRRMLDKWGIEFDEYLRFHWAMIPKYARPNDFAWLMYVARFCARDNPDLALEHAWRAVQVSPSSYQPYQILGAAFFRLGKIDDSIAAFETVLTLIEAAASTDGLEKPVLTRAMKREYVSATLKLSFAYLRSGARKQALETLSTLETRGEFLPLEAEEELKRAQILNLVRESDR